MENTQLRSAIGYNVDNVKFSKVLIQKIGDTGMTSKRINITTKNDDGTEGELVFVTERLFSYGVSENADQVTQKINGYTMPLCLHSKDGASEEEQAFTDILEKITDKAKDFLVDNKKELKMKDLERSDLRKLNPVYYKKNADGEIMTDVSPTLYAKLIMSKKNGQNKIITEFFDGVTGDSFKPLDLIGKYCYVRAVVKIESLFLGSKISLQVKLYEAEVNLINSGVKRLLTRPVAKPQVSNLSNSTVTNPLNMDDDDASSIKDEEVAVEEEKVTVSELPVKKKKVVVVKKKPE